MYYTAKLQNNSPQHLESWQNLLCFAESGSSLSVLLMHCYLYTLFTAILFFIFLAGKVIEN